MSIVGIHAVYKGYADVVSPKKAPINKHDWAGPITVYGKPKSTLDTLKQSALLLK
jgi:hypothetical protein